MSLTVGEGSRGGGEGQRQLFPTLTATNYTSWSIRVGAIMEEQGWWEIVEPPETDPATALTAAQTATQVTKDKKIRTHLFQCLSDDLLMQVAKKKTGKEVWDALKARFVGAERVRDARLQNLKSEFDALEMKETDSIDEFAGKLTAMSVRYGNLGGTLDETVMVKKLLNTVPERFIQCVAGIEQFCDLKTMVLDDAIGRLRTYEERTKRGAGGVRSENGHVLLTQAEWDARQKKLAGESSGGGRSQGSGSRGRGRGGGRGGRSGRGDSGSTERKDKSHIKCFKCKQFGHYANRCPNQKKEEEAHHSKAEIEPSVLVAELEVLNSGKNPHLKVQNKLCLNGGPMQPELHFTGNGEPTGDTWYLDSGASNHMTGDRKKFLEMDSTFLGKVKFGDGSSVDIQGIGSIVFEGNSGNKWVLRNVYYIPKLRANLISLGQLTENGHIVVMDDDIITVTEKVPHRMIMCVKRTGNRMYKIGLSVGEPVCLLTSLEDQGWLWHGRLGHVNFHALKQLVDKEMAGGVPLIQKPDQVCQSCLAAKQTRLSFPRSVVWRAEEPLGLIHVDLCGPINPVSVSGNKYFMLLVDDCTRWCSVYMLKSKDEAVEAFVKFKAQVENNCSDKIKVLRSDRGGEFLNGIFQRICDQAGIKRQFTAPYTPQQNGVVERKNRTVMEMTRALMKSMKIPGRFWAEAVRHAVYLLNRLPTKAMGYRTPYEAWNGKRPHLGHLRIFGCKGHVKTVKPHLKKLEDRSVPMVYFGIEEGSKAHRMYNPQTNKIVVSRDVVFEETEKWDWEAAETEEISVEMEIGQWYSDGDLNNDEGDVVAPQGSQAGQTAENTGGQHFVGGGDASAVQSDGQTESVQNPTIEMQAESGQQSGHS